MTALPTHSKSHGELTPEAFLARVRESATSVSQAVAEFLTAVEHGCTEQGREGWKELVLKWQGAVEPDGLRAMESTAELLSVFNPPPPGEPPNITASYTPPETLPQHAAMLRRTHRTAVNVFVTLEHIMVHLPRIDPSEIDRLRTLKDALQDYSVNNDATGNDPVDDSIQPEATVVADPSNVGGAQIRLRLDPASRIVDFDGTTYRLNSECTQLLAGLIEARCEWRTAKKLKTMRVDRVMDNMPRSIQPYVESRPFLGHRLTIPAAIR